MCSRVSRAAWLIGEYVMAQAAGIVIVSLVGLLIRGVLEGVESALFVSEVMGDAWLTLLGC